MLEFKREKRKTERIERTPAQANKTYQDYDWNGMLNDGSLSKQTAAVLDTYINYHQLKSHPTKKEKLIEVQRHIINQLPTNKPHFHLMMKMKMMKLILY